MLPRGTLSLDVQNGRRDPEEVLMIDWRGCSCQKRAILHSSGDRQMQERRLRCYRCRATHCARNSRFFRFPHESCRLLSFSSKAATRLDLPAPEPTWLVRLYASERSTARNSSARNADALVTSPRLACAHVASCRALSQSLWLNIAHYGCSP